MSNGMIIMSQLSSSQTRPTSKKPSNACSQRGCHAPRQVESCVCEHHHTDFFYLDIAHEVDVLGDDHTSSGIFRQVQAERRRILEKHFSDETNQRMQTLEVSSATMALLKPCIKRCCRKGHVVMCSQPVKHREYHLCPKHLRLELLTSLRRRHNRLIDLRERDNDLYEIALKRLAQTDLPAHIRASALPADVSEQLNQISGKLTQNIREAARCRYDTRAEFCNAVVDEYMHTGYCPKHIHAPQALHCLLKRQRILRASVLNRHLREVLVSYI